MADDTTGAGQQDPSDSVGPFNPQAFIIAQMIAKISTMKIVQVKAVDADAKTVDVQPMVNMLNGNNESSPHGTILGIPYWAWQFGKNKIDATPVVDDIGLMICSDRDISAVVSAKKIANPGTQRKHDNADGVYLGGMLNGDPEQWIKFTDTGMELHDKNSNSIVSSNTGWLFTGKCTFVDPLVAQANFQLGGDLTDVAGTGNYGGSIHIGGTLTADVDVVYGAGGTRVTLKGHQHTGNNLPPTPGH